jgi:hypothetical protein
VQDRVGPAAQLVAIRLRHAEHLADHVHRQLAREVGQEVAAAGAAHALEVAHRERADARLEVGDAPRREALRDQRADAVVPRRIHREDREHRRAVGAELPHLERDPARVGEVLPILEAREHVGVARERPEADLLVPVDRRLFAQRAIRRIRVLVELVVERVELSQARFSVSR